MIAQIRLCLVPLCWTVLVSSAALAQATCAPESVFLRGDWGTSRFSIEIADDPAERARGLMHRESLPTSAGMLFIYEAPQPVSFWMRNTLIPLDILFVDATGVVQHIHHQAQPLDETPIPGGEDVFAVLEINGGLSRQLGISVGTQLRHPAFDALNPAWPCR